jgi:hypothetical protein
MIVNWDQLAYDMMSQWQFVLKLGKESSGSINGWEFLDIWSNFQNTQKLLL